MTSSKDLLISKALSSPFFKKDALTATALAEKFRSQSLSIVSYLSDLITHIENFNPQINALTSVQKEYALNKAKELEEVGPKEGQTLYGVPIIIKENIQKIGFPVSCGSKMLLNYQGQYDAYVVKELEKAGAILLGTSNMDEFAMGSSNEHSIHGPVKNPFHLNHVSGGSSGGSAAACAAHFAPLVLGSDTGGSVRQPAAFCGLYGFKPTYGRISRYGLVAYGSSLDQISPFARSAEDLDLLLSVIGKPDENDETTLSASYESLPKEPLTKLGC
jgi:aspartyl-tRNA(Asn)/glutamyl-tRNA(Gln) amidotransferase subunit A